MIWLSFLCIAYVAHEPSMNESWHKYECVMSHVWISHAWRLCSQSCSERTPFWAIFLKSVTHIFLKVVARVTVDWREPLSGLFSSNSEDTEEYGWVLTNMNSFMSDELWIWMSYKYLPAASEIEWVMWMNHVKCNTYVSHVTRGGVIFHTTSSFLVVSNSCVPVAESNELCE